MRIQLPRLLLAFCFLSANLVAQPKPPRPSAGWIDLFNGKDLSNWVVKITGHAAGDNYGNTFRVENGVLLVRYDAYKAFDEQYGHLVSRQPYSAYLLAVEYRFTGDQVAGGPGWALRNSGVMLHGQAPETMGLKQDFPISLEMQLLGGTGQRERHTANLCTPGTNVVLNGRLHTDHCVDSNSKTYAADQWVHAEALVLGDSLLQHIVEGDTVLTYSKPQIGGGNVSGHDPTQKPDGLPLKSGYISLQSESSPVEFRRVALFDLSAYLNKPEQLRAVLNQLRNRKKSEPRRP